mmetsp:Transcript_2784/g.5614  ORF Transcript_2784/g.5614 Transcript_2784/m.5614 type:complete len:91 (-) Transcript_2784:286-558(-)
MTPRGNCRIVRHLHLTDPGYISSLHSDEKAEHHCVDDGDDNDDRSLSVRERVTFGIPIGTTTRRQPRGGLGGKETRGGWSRRRLRRLAAS